MKSILLDIKGRKIFRPYVSLNIPALKREAPDPEKAVGGSRRKEYQTLYIYNRHVLFKTLHVYPFFLE